MKMLTVVAALIQKDGKVLICQRPLSQSHAGKWEFPGGKVEPGETPDTALKRELVEELNIDAAVGAEVERYSYAYPGKPPILLVFFRVTEYAGEPQNLVFARIEWADFKDLPSYDFLEGDMDFVKRLASV
jgi:8-oxo-dGTP diphosphatase